jgi:hypothetical protein
MRLLILLFSPPTAPGGADRGFAVAETAQRAGHLVSFLGYAINAFCPVMPGAPLAAMWAGYHLWNHEVNQKAGISVP